MVEFGSELKSIEREEFMKLNLGCGAQTPEGWINVDYAFGARLARMPLFGQFNRRVRLFALDWNEDLFLHDLTKEFPWTGGTADIVYSSHTLEHFSRSQGVFFLKESHRVLKCGGTIRVVVPDLSAIVNAYRDGRVRADAFLESLGVLDENKGSRIKTWLGHFIHYSHKCMYDTPTLLTLLRELGFEAHSRNAFDSDIPDIRLVELEDRTRDAVIVEGRKA
jgi:predicted SAM-dependent methyltransferase